MRIAVVSDIHGNLTAFEAVLADLRDTSPDLIFHGGDLADAGSSPAEIVDRVRDMRWPGVVGNTDEMLAMPEAFEHFASRSPQLESLWSAVREMATVTREALGEARLAWLRQLPRAQVHAPLALVHASPDTAWRAPNPEASDAELKSVYGPLGQPVVTYGHIHRSFIRSIGELTVVNTGSVSFSYDSDPRAAYLLLDGTTPAIHRVEYDVEKEIKALTDTGFPHNAWIARTLRAAAPQMP
jgi:predicted phosphodiesterase